MLLVFMFFENKKIHGWTVTRGHNPAIQQLMRKRVLQAGLHKHVFTWIDIWRLANASCFHVFRKQEDIWLASFNLLPV